MVEYMEWLREDLTGINTYVETEIACPVGRSDNIVMAIHEIQFSFSLATPTGLNAADNDMLCAHIAKKTKAAIAAINDPDCIDMVREFFNMTTSGVFKTDMPLIHHFYPPILIANSKLYLGATSSVGSTLLYVRIGYTLRKVSRAELYDALVD